MQTEPEQLKRQQVILKHLGHYRDRCDGIWAVKSIEAMKKYERHPSFKPGIPTNGLPFSSTGPLPAGISRDPNNPRLLTCEGLDDKRAAEILERERPREPAQQPTPKQEPAQANQQPTPKQEHKEHVKEHRK